MEQTEAFEIKFAQANARCRVKDTLLAKRFSICVCVSVGASNEEEDFLYSSREYSRARSEQAPPQTFRVASRKIKYLTCLQSTRLIRVAYLLDKNAAYLFP